MLYHYIFNTYSGINILDDMKIRNFLLKIFNDIAKNKGFKIIECEILEDHVHMLTDQPYSISPSSAMKYIKGISARYLFKEYPTNRSDIRKLWARSYNFRKITEKQKEKVINYIKGQRDMQGIDKRY
jgi:putative transposase